MKDGIYGYYSNYVAYESSQVAVWVLYVIILLVWRNCLISDVNISPPILQTCLTSTS